VHEFTTTTTDNDHLRDIVDTKNGVDSFEADHRFAQLYHDFAAGVVAALVPLLEYFCQV